MVSTNKGRGGFRRSSCCVASYENILILRRCSYVGYVDLYGTMFSEDFAATGFGTHVALPIIRDRWRADLSEGEARAVLEDCVRVLWYRDTRALNKITLAKVRLLLKSASIRSHAITLCNPPFSYI